MMLKNSRLFSTISALKGCTRNKFHQASELCCTLGVIALSTKANQVFSEKDSSMDLTFQHFKDGKQSNLICRSRLLVICFYIMLLLVKDKFLHYSRPQALRHISLY